MPDHAYDANGNTLTDAQGRQFTWDFEDRLTQVVNPGVGTTTFRYDPFGRRIQKSGPLGTTNYLYDGDNLLEEVDQTGTVLARYSEGRAMDEPLAQLRSGSTAYYQQDGLNSVTSLSTPVGALTNTYAYDSYGNQTSATGTFVNSLQYTGREFDSETGFYFYRARYYDPSSSRFGSEDPLGFSGGTNFYSYTGNDPVLLGDPYGLKPCKKSCGLRKGPEYDVSGAVPAGTAFHWSATFLNDETHSPSCCEVRQLISWNQPPWPGHSAPHSGFQPPRDQPGNWYEDRDDQGTRYGRRTGPYVDRLPNGNWPAYNQYSNDSYYGEDQPGGPNPPSLPGFTLRFRLIVVDVCNGGNTIYTSKTISVNF